jgi:5-(carboxyamino)imidazole ribonucleotide mutase
MPNGVPVATVALNAAQNAGILAAQIISSGDLLMMKKVIAYKDSLREKVMIAAEEMELNAKKDDKVKTNKKPAAKKKKK